MKCPLFLSGFNEIWISSSELRKILKYKISRKLSSGIQVVSMRTDGRTDMTKLIVAFRYFANAPKNSTPFSVPVCSCKNLLNIFYFKPFSSPFHALFLHEFPFLPCQLFVLSILKILKFFLWKSIFP